MVLLLARQSVIIKCKLNASILTGNYEFYYAAGILYKLNGKTEEKVPQPEELMEKVQKLATEYKTEDKKEKYLVKILTEYQLEETYAEQMDVLFKIGNQENYMWQEKLFDAQ